MARDIELIDIDELYRSSSREKIAINNIDVTSEQDKEAVNKLLLTQLGSGFLDSEPSCMCGMTKGGYLVSKTCPECHTEVSALTDRDITTSLWINLPRGVNAFIHPKVYSILDDILTVSKFHILEYLVNPNYRPLTETKNVQVQRFLRMELPRGINHFHKHFDDIMRRLIEGKVIMKDPMDNRGGMGRLNSLIAFLAMYRDRIFCHHLPMPTNLLMVTEKTVTTTFTSSQMFPALDAARIISAVEENIQHLSQRTLESKVMVANRKMAEYSETFFSDFYDSKDGWYRQQVYGARSHMTYRGVINSLTPAHDYRELHLPWSLAVGLFRNHLVTKLLQRNWSIRKAQSYLDEYTLCYSPILDELFKEMIAESFTGCGIPTLFNRNPSLLRGSVQLLHITQVKTDVEIRSISLSPLILRNFNADFDGKAFAVYKTL